MSLHQGGRGGWGQILVPSCLWLAHRVVTSLTRGPAQLHAQPGLCLICSDHRANVLNKVSAWVSHYSSGFYVTYRGVMVYFAWVTKLIQEKHFCYVVSLEKKNTEKKKEETCGPEQWDLDEKVPLDTREIMKKNVVNLVFFFLAGKGKKGSTRRRKKNHYTFTKQLQCL